MLLMLGASGQPAGVRHALKEAHRIARRHQGVAIGQAMGKKWKENRFRNVYLRNALVAQGLCHRHGGDRLRLDAGSNP
jgi:alkyldihydroxyacetonephosphate synthase